MAVSFSKTKKGQVFLPVDEPGLKTYLCVTTFETGDETYATAGLAADLPALFNLSSGADILYCGIELVGAKADEKPTTAVGARYDRTNKKILFYTSNGAAPAALAELANGNTTVADNVKGRILMFVVDT